MSKIKGFIVVALASLLPSVATASERAQAAWDWIEQDAVVIDVRTVGEFQSGHLQGALNIPVGELDRADLSFLAKNQPVVVYCRSGNRSGSAEQILLSKGYVKVHNGGGLNELMSVKSK
ncbi:rhodanese-like domain-containing protein [Vibrio ulleungensis]|uniref:Rhodanese-like domain-containing protein n=1 Tax=Vibrio ulleungensis TaxID=2807619 RepID=A0ABS2HH60_9VIBR|nr:rhodanese-like domain-containing protein [Vibrio ulleungensis]MBM7036006.1 rhodanese-like domain-containing protein [Vibrio ulleungensis]